MIHEEELVFYRDKESGRPCLGRIDKGTGDIRYVEIEDVLGESLDGDEPVPVLVTYDVKACGIDMEEAYSRYFKVIKNHQSLALEDASGHRGRFLRKINSVSYPYALAVTIDGEEIPMSYAIDGRCSTGKKEDTMTRMILLSQDGSEDVLKECGTAAGTHPEEKKTNVNGTVDASDFPEMIED